MELAIITIACAALLALSPLLGHKRPPLQPLKTDITIKQREENAFDCFHQVPMTELFTCEDKS